MTHTPLIDTAPPQRLASSRRSRPSRWLPAIVAALLIGLGFSSLMRPSAGAADAPLVEFSAARAMTHVDRIASEPRPMGSTSIQLAESYITGQLTGMGLDPEIQPIEVPDYFGTPGETVVARNIIVTIPGANPSGSLAFVAHYDTDPKTPGANDNAGAVAVLIETARAVLAGEPPGNDIVLLFTDGEEPQPRFGATAFVEQHERFDDIGLVVNLEALGSSGPSQLVQLTPADGEFVRRFLSVTPNPVAFSFLTETVDLTGGVGTDFDVFAERGVPGLSFAYLRGSSIYHTERDSVDNVSLSSLQHHGDNVMAIVDAFAHSELPPTEAGSTAAFFTLTPMLTVTYGHSAAAAFAVLAGLGFVAAIAFGVRSGRFGFAAMGRGVVVLLAGSVAASLVVTASWWLFTAVRSTPGVFESYAYLAALSAIAVVVLSYVGGALAGSHSDADLAPGIVLVWVVLAAVTTYWLPGFSYLFVWPALGGAIALAWSLSGRAGRWLWLVVAAPAVVLSIPALDAFFQMAQPRPGNPDSDLTPVIGLVGLLVALLMGLVVPFLPRLRRSF